MARLFLMAIAIGLLLSSCYMKEEAPVIQPTGNITFKRVVPPNWWAGMKHEKLQVLFVIL